MIRLERLEGLSGLLKKIVSAVGAAAAWSAVALIFVILFDVVTRRFFSAGSSKLQELEWHLHAVLFLLCLGVGYLRDAHVRIDIFWDRLGPRGKCWVEIVGILLFMIPFCLIVIWYGGDLTWRAFEKSEVSSSGTGLPYRWLIKSMVPIGMTVLLLSGISVLLDKIVALRRLDARTGEPGPLPPAAG